MTQSMSSAGSSGGTAGLASCLNGGRRDTDPVGDALALTSALTGDAACSSLDSCERRRRVAKGAMASQTCLEWQSAATTSHARRATDGSGEEVSERIGIGWPAFHTWMAYGVRDAVVCASVQDRF